MFLKESDVINYEEIENMGLIRFIQDHNRNVELKKMRQIQEQKPKSSKIYCPKCNRKISTEDQFCRSCGMTLK